ncbi:hypothetical protein F5B18DRAFT_28530 [Nemania serpens]|nr:hypothetical protein F5B18DRAFT_28530 [Nemania serpens]
MSEAYERERQNNARLEELSAKVSSLRGVTVDIYDNARAQDVIDNTVRPLIPPLPPKPIPLPQHQSSFPPHLSFPGTKADERDNLTTKQTDTFSSMSTQLKGSAGRLGRMAAAGNKVAILKLSGIVIGVFLVLYYVAKWIF